MPVAEPALSPEMEVSAEHDGRILTGVGVEVSDLEATMAREAPDEPSEPSDPPTAAEATPDPSTAQPDRNADGTFKKAAKGRARFSELTSERDEAKAAAEAAQRERDELRSRLEALERGQKPAEATKAAPEPAAPQPTRPKPEWDDTKYASYEEFIDARAEWVAEQREAALWHRIGAAMSARDARSAQWQEIQRRGSAAYPDWGAKIAAAEAQKYSPAHLEAIFQAPNSEHVQYALASDAALAARVAAMPVGVELGYLFASLSASPRDRVASPASTPPAVTSRASAPYQPVGAATKTASPSLSDLADHGDDFDASGYRERRRQERMASGR